MAAAEHIQETDELMNSEILQMARLTLIARRFLKNGEVVDCLDHQKIKRLVFHVRNRCFGLLPYGQKLDGLDKWLEYLRHKACTSIYLILPDEIDERDNISLSTSVLNVNSSWVMVTNTARDYSVWNRQWKKLKGQGNGWEIDYYEKAVPGRNPLDYQLHYDPTELPAALGQMKSFALEISCPAWADRFEEAAAMARGEKEARPTHELDCKGLLPADKIVLLNVLSRAWVFGEMRSWNDEGASAAAGQGRKDDYQHLTWRLYQAIMRALMHCFNDD